MRHISASSLLVRMLIAAFLQAALLQEAFAADDLTKSIRPSADGHFLAQPDGKPFFWQGDTAWTLFSRLTREETEDYFRDRAKKGYNVVLAVAIGGPWYEIDTANRYQERSIFNKNPLTPNERYFKHVDWVVERAAAHGIRIAMLPVWSITDISRAKEKIFSERVAREYARWLAHRYRGKGTIWVLGGDSNPLWPDLNAGEFPSVIDYRPIYDALARGLAEGAGENPFITYHPTGIRFSGTSEPRTSLFFHDRPWLAMNMIQSSHFVRPTSLLDELRADSVWDSTRNYEPIEAEYKSIPTRPVVDGEARFEDLSIDLDENAKYGHWKGYDIRNAAYHSVFAGAAGHTYGHHSIWQFVGASNQSYQLANGLKNWRDALQAESSSQMQHLKNLMLSRPYFMRVPDQSLLVDGAGDGESHVSVTRGKDGSYAMVYSPKGAPFRLDLSALSGSSAVAWWFDPRTGQSSRASRTYSTTGAQTFEPPSSGSESDWVLVLDDPRSGFQAPGAVK